jgi:hypothetical protein
MAEGSETKLYSLAQVAENNNNKKTWIVIHNSVYDVTLFLNEVSIFHYFCDFLEDLGSSILYVGCWLFVVKI